MDRPHSRRFFTGGVLLLALCLAIASARAAEEADTATTGFAGMVRPGVALFLPEGLNPGRMPPSLALLEPPKVTGPLPTEWTLRPAFSKPAGGKTLVTLVVPAGTSLYGEGEVTGPLLRNGTHTVLWNTDNGGYGADGGRRLYQSHPWVLGIRPDGSAFGFLADTTYRAEIDLTNGIAFAGDGPPFPVLILEGRSPQEVLVSLATLIGTMPLPPRWALGYHQCRYSYKTADRVREIAANFRSRHIPADVIWMDIDYMNGYRDFTFNPQAFPDPKRLFDDLHAHGFKAICMIDPGVKAADPDYPVLKSGDAADVWVKNADGSDYQGDVWPGACKFPDFTRPASAAWWAGWYHDFVALGIDGVWNDMNEPAVFHTPDRTMPLETQFRGGGGLPPGPQLEYHNVYGMLETRATRAGIAAAHPDKRPFVLTRASFLGGQRYAATWTGDNVSKWEHLKLSIPMSITLGLSGQPMSGPDVGGFGGTATPDLWANWVAVGAFYPFCRGHADSDTPEKEPWVFGPETETVARTALQRRYRLLPYLYTLFHENSSDGLPILRPVFLADPADAALRAEQEAFLFGGDLLVIPRWAAQPHLPKGRWQPVQLVPGEDTAPNNKYQPEVRLRGGAIVPLGKIVENTGEESLDPLTLLVCLDEAGRADGTLYEDAGDGYGYQRGDYLLTTYHAQREGGSVVVTVAGTEGQRKRPARQVSVQVVGEHGLATGTGMDGEPIRLPLPPAS